MEQPVGLNSAGILCFESCGWGCKQQDFDNIQAQNIPKGAKRRGGLYLFEIIQWLF